MLGHSARFAYDRAAVAEDGSVTSEKCRLEIEILPGACYRGEPVPCLQAHRRALEPESSTLERRDGLHWDDLGARMSKKWWGIRGKRVAGLRSGQSKLQTLARSPRFRVHCG